MRTLVVACCLALGCGALGTEQEQRDLLAKVQEVRVHMHARFAATRNIEQAIAFGDLPRARVEARTIATLEEPDALPEWQPYLESVRNAASQIVSAKDTLAAGRMLALVGRQCARCHEAGAARIAFPPEAAPPGNPALATQMASHQWAVARMWEGLVGPSEELWLRGAHALADARIAIVAEGDLLPELAAGDDVARLHLFAKRALVARTLDDRQATFGDILATCAGCHHAIRDR